MAPKNDKSLFASLATFAVGTLAAGALVAVPVKAFAEDHAADAAHESAGEKKCSGAKTDAHEADKKCSGAKADEHATEADKKCAGDKACGASTTKGH